MAQIIRQLQYSSYNPNTWTVLCKCANMHYVTLIKPFQASWMLIPIITDTDGMLILDMLYVTYTYMHTDAQ